MKATAQIFLCYAQEDEEKVESLYQRLSDAGFKPWMAKKDIVGGEIWQLSIQQAIRRSDFVVICLSATSVKKRSFIQREIKDALDIWREKLESDIYLIPVRLEDCEVPESLCRFQWVNLFEEDGWIRLVKAIQVGMERLPGSGITLPPSPPSQPWWLMNWKMVGAVVGVIGLLIALGAWLVPNDAAGWLFKTSTAAPINSPTHTPAIPTATPTSTSVPPTATLTFTPSPTPTPVLPTDTPLPPTPTYTPVPPTPTKSNMLSCTILPLDEFAPLWEKNRNGLGCPVDKGTVVSPACEEAFEGGHLFWRSDTTQIYIVYDRDKTTGQELFSGDWFIGPREWGWDRSNPSGIGLEPPPNRYEPIGGLGWLWREYLGREDGRLGWATGKEYCFEGLAIAQSYQNGLTYKSSDSKIYALLHNEKFVASR